MFPLSFKAIIVIISLIMLSAGAQIGHVILIITGLIGVIDPLLVPTLFRAIGRLDSWLWPPTIERDQWPRRPSRK